jgi:ketosteroid isomerase-like protein
MSQENVEAVRAGFDGFNRGDVEAVVEMCDPAVEWFPPAELPGVNAYRGHQGVRAAAGDMLDVFGALQAEPGRLIEAEDRVVVLFRWRGHGKGSGLSLDLFGKQAVVFTMRNGKAIRVEWYLDRAKAFKAAGLSEQDARAD